MVPHLGAKSRPLVLVNTLSRCDCYLGFVIPHEGEPIPSLERLNSGKSITFIDYSTAFLATARGVRRRCAREWIDILSLSAALKPERV